jgi:hypothetical protein
VATLTQGEARFPLGFFSTNFLNELTQQPTEGGHHPHFLKIPRFPSDFTQRPNGRGQRAEGGHHPHFLKIPRFPSDFTQRPNGRGLRAEGGHHPHFLKIPRFPSDFTQRPNGRGHTYAQGDTIHSLFMYPNSPPFLRNKPRGHTYTNRGQYTPQ